MKQIRKILKVSLLIIALAISIAILSACNDSQSTLPNEHFDGNCITKGFTRYYMPNGSYVDREDEEFGDHSYDDGVEISTLSCTQKGITKFTCELCKRERFETVDELGHDYVAVEGSLVEPTCTDDGHEDYECQRCSNAYTQPLDKLGHDFDETVLEEPTCTEEGSKFLECKRCEFSTTEAIQKLNHDYDETVVTAPTCTEEGFKTMVCKNCGDNSSGAIAKLPHTPKSDALRDDEGHWFICEVCDNEYGYTEHIEVQTYVPSTCIKHAYTHITCRDCDYYRDVEDVTSPLMDHSYEAYTCIVCQRDNLLDYKSEFDSKGANATNLISIESENMFVCFYDYLIAYQITTPKYIEIKYNTNITIDNVNEFLSSVRRKITATNWSVETMYSQANGKVKYLHINASNSGNFKFNEVATYAPSSYNATTYDQYGSYQFGNNTARPVSFDDFAYKSRLNPMTVSSSDQLFFAFEHGYRPVATVGSTAESMLNKAKIVARRIMNDSMSELEKVRAIYNYLVSDVAYDYGIVKATNASTPFAKCSSYYLEGVFNYGIAVCDGISKAYCVLAGLEDIKCVRVTSDNHAWNKVYIDVNGDGNKAWFGSDATWGNQSIEKTGSNNGEYLSVEHFLFTDAQKTARGQRGLNYANTNSNAVTEENPFEYFYFGEDKDSTCDFVITSDSELSDMISYMRTAYNSLDSHNTITLNFYFTTAYCSKSEISNKVTTALRKQWILMYPNVYYINISNSDSLIYDGVEGYAFSIFIKT